MKFTFKNVLINAFTYWGCPFREEDLNIFRVEIEPGSIAESICEATGKVHIGIEEFEDEIIATYETWRSFTPGSYYLHRLLEHLREGPITGATSINASYRSPDIYDLFSLKQFSSAQCLFSHQGEKQELVVASPTFHFAVSLLGLEPRTELISLTIEPLRKNLLPEVDSFEPYQGEAVPSEQIGVRGTFPFAVKELKRRIERLLGQYKMDRLNITAQAIRKIRAAKRIDLAALSNSKGNAEIIRKREEIEEIWTIREQDARLRGEAERVDVSLVAITVQKRPLTLYRVDLVLPGNRRRILERLYDRSIDWTEPLRCEICDQIVDLFIPGEGACKHLICGDCVTQGTDCSHKICIECSLKCSQCGVPSCPICDPACVECGEISCHSHREVCTICDNSLCKDCSPRCSGCGERYCLTDGISCSVCKQVMCPDHKKHKTDQGVFRISIGTFQELRLKDVAADSDILYQAFKGKKRFLKALKTTLGEEVFNKFKALILKDSDKCYEILVEGYLEELIDDIINDEMYSIFKSSLLKHSVEYYEVLVENRIEQRIEDIFNISHSDTMSKIRNRILPLALRKKDKAVISALRSAEPKLLVSLDDLDWWLDYAGVISDPFLNEYGFLPSYNSNNKPLEKHDFEEILREGWFDHDLHSDPTNEIIPFYDPGSLEELNGPHCKRKNRFI